MRSGNRLGLSVIGAAVTLLGMTAGARAADRVTPVPLGGSLERQSGEHPYGVYIPTRFGGSLTISTTSGKVVELKGPSGPNQKARSNGEDIGQDQQGWYTFKVKGADKPFTVETKFVQAAQSARKPWNFYYWPTKADSIHEPWAGGNGRVDIDYTMVRGDDQLIRQPGGYIPPGEDIVLAGPDGRLETLPPAGDDATWFPNLYDDLTWTGPNKEKGNEVTIFQTPSPLLKYDQLFGTSARWWEAVNSQNKDISRWPGHCLGGAVASILMNEPVPAPGTGLTKDELKALWAELGENHLNHRIGDYATDIPPGPPRPGPDECDWKAPRVHAMLETHIRGQKQALLGNMRAFPPRGTINEVWNQGIYKYVAQFKAIPGRGERAVNVKLELHTNSGSMLNGADDKDRVILYEYNIVYGLDGQVDETNPGAADWVSVGGEALFAPLNVLEVVQTVWQGHNPYVTEANVRALDMANGGDRFRFASAPPQFRPVLEYEGRRSAPASNNAMANDGGGSGGSRRGFFRFFGR
ncbi:hypothetical protein OJF2_14670 [Aquisphaera giovannonii]|uniref:Uncharacterized protein n=1 Tax=Aquisphaera giovannonii TaxID=406548 RepID=A0A5B9VYZ9_9BACT|nr:hypothetical protein OJF2_14670 [Aquisphaera giovannonii]